VCIPCPSNIYCAEYSLSSFHLSSKKSIRGESAFYSLFHSASHSLFQYRREDGNSYKSYMDCHQCRRRPYKKEARVVGERKALNETQFGRAIISHKAVRFVLGTEKRIPWGKLFIRVGYTADRDFSLVFPLHNDERGQSLGATHAH
jgi:hypothetical protein